MRMRIHLPKVILLAAAHAAGALALAGCATPGAEVAPQADDFAFIEMQLQG